ncbi:MULTISPECIES: helix-turn-helix transcriptional regulator [unclassified Gemella]|uniref:helix-turn-helix transcriptional regulator n=1 Tax=unclassified Gemella TaxID=2624949 RepID=UPI0015D023F0|nr:MULTISPECIES: helix-turn-helix transcriptional regulator [unclassified Gemella]MBF0710580.1 helix-turn-helix transcriptional regulator [Gemella sp. GL1.1]NYS27924.1 helix-turn-helix transcriptional regulator [Gemella sp. GL1]
MEMTLKMLRIRKELTLKEVAKEVGVVATTVSKWEKGKTYPEVLHIKKLSVIYGYPVHTIFFDY